ncbi:hypothetical protein LOCC1_G008295 [Lachnellula occidentalis]|uniref:Uncharacterized protein n=1 Tax=Lachnellula occidentalis TaxID=215460 RepID=A0A8H8RGW0_9HELO|nr:hypothetical protein LOCC1_G008295 [Lachnellula occidentalis]
MRAGYETVIRTQLILLSSWTCISSASILKNLPREYPLNIDWGPAPSPENGPPLSAGASRDKSLLPAQIGAIVGSYLVCVCIVGCALILIGRRLRQQIQYTPKVLDIEMIQPYAIDITPVSPGAKTPNGTRNFSWPSPEKTDRNPYVFPSTNRSPITPPGIADPFVDTKILDADRDMLQRDLEDIYAHVMEHEEAKAAGIDPREMPPPRPLQGVGPTPTASPQRNNLSSKKIEKARPANINIDETKSIRSRTSSIMSALKSPRKKSVKSIEISSPILTPASSTFPKHVHNASDLEPLAPRYYSPPPPPPIPKDQVPYTHSRNNSNISPTSPTRSIAQQLSEAPQSQQHQPYSSQASTYSTNRGDISAISAKTTNSQTPLYTPRAPRAPPQLQIHPVAPHPKPFSSNPPSTNSSTRALPFRAFEPPLASPSFVAQTTKTTVLERTKGPTGPQTGGLKTPWSAGAVPYSPYQPFSPMIPITPRLVTKEDRKAAKKAEGRGPVRELIKSGDELWDSGY